MKVAEELGVSVVKGVGKRLVWGTHGTTFPRIEVHRARSRSAASLKFDQDLSALHEVADPGVDLPDLAGDGGGEREGQRGTGTVLSMPVPLSRVSGELLS